MSPKLIIDMRCLQDRHHAERCIGHHASGIVSRAPVPFIGLVDPDLPALPSHFAGLAESLSPHAYIPNITPGTVLLNPAPMGRPDQSFLARLLCHPGITKAALVHDFIPFDHQESYLTPARPRERLKYFSSMAWLRRYDLFLPISEDTDQRLKTLYGTVESQVTGVALPYWMHRVTPREPQHILMIGGEEPRKNPELLLRACAGSATLRDLPVMITGGYSAATEARLRELFPATFPGWITEIEMRALYAAAICVVTPSWAAGFSLPIIEAAAAQTPAVVSDLPAHRALITDPALRFAPDDADRLASILERLVQEKPYRAEVVAQQWPVWQRFSGAAVARTVWSALTPARPALRRHAKPRLAMLSPLPPAKSGVANYSAALARTLAAQVALTLFTEESMQTTAHLSRNFDRVISTIGNSSLHSGIYDHAVKWGSAAICHDAKLFGLSTRFGLEHAASLASAEIGRQVTPQEIGCWTADEDTRQASFLGPLAQAARPLIFHAPQPVELVQRRFGATARYLPLAIYRPFDAPVTPAAKAAARAALKLDPAKKIIASFGFVSASKGIGEALHAFALLRGTVNCQLLFVGQVNHGETRFQTLAHRFGIADAVHFSGTFLSEAEYRLHLLAVDGALQLRKTGTGQVSGALQDCIAAGLPTVASRDLAENLQAPSYVRRVSDQLNPQEIALALRETLDAAARHDREFERTDYCATHSMSRYAKSLLEILEI
jgi:glycosyltransferase involved in cell wall biosynthesis